MRFNTISFLLASSLLMFTLVACGGGGSGGGGSDGQGGASGLHTTSSFMAGGNIVGLASGATLALSIHVVEASNSCSDETKSFTVNQAFSFYTKVPKNGSYAVTITAQPAGQTCSVRNAIGAGVTAAVANVDVTCSARDPLQNTGRTLVA